jgi:hypothetical protein
LEGFWKSRASVLPESEREYLEGFLFNLPASANMLFISSAVRSFMEIRSFFTIRSSLPALPAFRY